MHIVGGDSVSLRDILLQLGSKPKEHEAIGVACMLGLPVQNKVSVTPVSIPTPPLTHESHEQLR